MIGSDAHAATRWIRRAFALWAAVVFSGTHWPNLKLPPVTQRPDLWLHMAAFGPWTILLGLCAFFGPRWSLANIGGATIVALAYAVFDETTQLLPILKRTGSLDDFGADCAGVLAGALALLAIGYFLRSRQKPPATP